MPLEPLSADALAQTPTVLSSFMGERDARRKTVGQLLSIYGERRAQITSAEDRDDDLRVERFAEDMARERWTTNVVVRIGEFDGKVMLIDGIHRSLAYLSCLAAGISPERLPALQIER